MLKFKKARYLTLPFTFILSIRLNTGLYVICFTILIINKYSIHFVLYLYRIHYNVTYLFRNFFLLNTDDGFDG